MSARFTIRSAVAADVHDYVALHIELTNVTYAHHAPPAFARNRRADYPARVEELEQDLAETAEAGAAGREPRRRHWVAVSNQGTVVGVMSAGVGSEPWEREVCGDAWFAPPSERILDHLYLVPGTHGTGLAERMVRLALPAGAPAYLWAFDDNLRAGAFYRKIGFAPDGLRARSGESWGDMPMSRWVRA